MNLLESAWGLAQEGFHVFPISPGQKAPPLFTGWIEKATRDPEQIKAWWERNPTANIGISTSKFGDDEALLVVDVDNKNGKKGDDELLRLELEGKEFPDTFIQRTPTGGRHLVYRVREPVRQGANVLGPGIDVRSRGGYIVGAGSCLPGGTYSASGGDIRDAPDWLIQSCGYSSRRETSKNTENSPGVDRVRAATRATHYLRSEAPHAVEGDGGDQTTFAVAARIKDFGVDLETAFQLLSTEWNEQCSPPWDPEDLYEKVKNAYLYGNKVPGEDAPEVQFAREKITASEKVIPNDEDTRQDLDPITKLNKKFAYIGGNKGFILHETKDAEGNFALEYIDVATFHQNLAPHTLSHGDKKVQISRKWIASPDRRDYQGLCFLPGKKPLPGFYNLWRGFAVEVLDRAPTKQEKASLDAFLEHAKNNVCAGEESLFVWLMGYFAHLVQRPWELPLVALVFRGKKGVGKNALVERVGHLLGNHFTVVSNRRYLTGNFNSFLENQLMLVLDEAFWSGDKPSEGILKDLITGTHRQIERKGQEPYRVKNCLRTVIIGNEGWLVPATEDERRYAVFDVGEGRRQDRSFFIEMREGMEAGGYRLLLKYLMDFDLSQVEVGSAPKTEALLDQKIESLDPFYQWWFECLSAGDITGSDFGGGWPAEITTVRFRDAYRRHVQGRNISRYLHADVSLGKLLRKCLPEAMRRMKRVDDSDDRFPVYVLPFLSAARDAWDQFIGHKVKWEVIDGNETIFD